ncbi:MAG: PAS domain-containing protein [Candidatus Sericytochromatia bacterium]|nr:PAS domain-containing protein [Candidatus Sericytochromatia bacterium]
MNRFNTLPELNFQRFFESLSGAYLVLTPEFIIKAVTDAYVKISRKNKDELIDRYLFEVFPNNVDDANVNGVKDLKISFNKVLKEKVSHFMDIVKYEIPLPNGKFEEKYWKKENSPIFNKNGELLYIIHKIEDITEFVMLKEKENVKKSNNLVKDSSLFTDELRLNRETEQQLDISVKQDEILNKIVELNAEKNKFSLLFTNAPVAITFSIGKDHVFEFANNFYKEVVLGDRPIIGLTLRETYPELEGQGIFEIYDEVYNSGIPFIGKEYLVKIDQKRTGILEDCYFDFIYQPIFDDNNQIEGVGTFAFNITEQVIARKHVEQLNKDLLASKSKYKQLSQSLEIEVHNRTKELKAEKEKLISLLTDAPAVIGIFNGPNHVFEFANNNFWKALGKRDLVGKTIKEAIPEISGQGFYEKLDEVYTTGKPFIGKEIYSRVDKKNNGQAEDVYWDFVYQPIYDKDNKITGISDFAFDITEQVIARQKVEKLNKELSESENRYRTLSEELEIKVGQRTEELSQSNQELKISYEELRNQNENLALLQEALLNRQEDLVAKEIELNRSNQSLNQFANMASHDLKEPLRMVKQYVQLLAKRYKNNLDADANDFIGYAVDGVDRMEHLIKSILGYAKLNKMGIPAEITLCQVALDKAKMNLTVAIEESGAKITNDELPSLHVNSVQLTQIFQNLLSNAIKYRSKDIPAKINIGVEKKERYWSFCVSDNGIGIKPEDFERIFQPFQRLHSNSEYEGIGLGLSFCKRTIEQYGGDMWVESESGKGTTVFFTIMEI